MPREQCIAADYKAAGSQFLELREHRTKIAFAAGIEDMQIQPENLCRRQIPLVYLVAGNKRVDLLRSANSGSVLTPFHHSMS